MQKMRWQQRVEHREGIGWKTEAWDGMKNGEVWRGTEMERCGVGCDGKCDGPMKGFGGAATV